MTTPAPATQPAPSSPPPATDRPPEPLHASLGSSRPPQAPVDTLGLSEPHEVLQADLYGDSLILDFKGHPIRVLLVRKVPWFELSDVCDALRPHEDVDRLVYDPDFPAFAKIPAQEDRDPNVHGEPQDVTLLSPVGVWYLTTLMDAPGKGQAIAAWAKRQAAQLCPDPAPGDPAVFLTILDVEGRKELPPYPWKFTGRRSEFLALKDSNAWVRRDDPFWKPGLKAPPAPVDPVARQQLRDRLLGEAEAAREAATQKMQERLLAEVQAAQEPAGPSVVPPTR